MPKISAIITTFNRAPFLKDAIKSVLSQTFKDFELLVLDNSSSDDTEKIVKSFGDKRIKYIRHKPLNISQARNLGVKEAQGEYIGFLDDDDEWLPNKLKHQLFVFSKNKDPDLGMVYGGFVWINPSGKLIREHKPESRGKLLKVFLWQKDPVTGSASNPLIRKTVFEVVGNYDEKVVTGEDWEFYLRLSEKYKSDFTKNNVLKIKHHCGIRLGGMTEDAAQLEIILLKRYKKIFDNNPKLKSFYLQKIGGKFCRLKQQKKGRKFIIKAIKVYPLNYKAYFQYVFSFLGKNFYLLIHKLYKNVTR
jgi:glycosyltransferase involved in cell wall biosynthesis